MKEMIAFLTFVSISSITIYLSVTKQIDLKLTSLLLIFSIASGFCISMCGPGGQMYLYDSTYIT